MLFTATSPRRGNRPSATFAAAVLFALFIAGCSTQPPTFSTPLSSAAGSNFSGRLMGGQQPVSSSIVQVIQAGTTSYGTAAALGGVLATTTSDANGNYSFPAGSYTCPTPTTPTLLVAKGGNPGLTAGTNNTGIYLAAYAGPCGQLTPSTFILINEVTTVATAFVLRPFATANSAAIGTSSTNIQGMTNAFATYNNLVSNARGVSPGDNVSASTSVPSLRINSLANVLAACVNSSSSTSTSCANLFSYTTLPSMTAPSNTFVATLNLATHPSSSATSIYNLAAATGPFQPTLSAAPNDWGLTITYTGGNLNSASEALAIDYRLYHTTNNLGSNELVSSGVGVLTSFTDVAIDRSGNVWLTRGSAGGLSEAVGAAAPTITPTVNNVVNNSYATRP